MKKSFYIFLSAIIMLTFASCGKKTNIDVKPSEMTTAIIKTFSQDISMNELNGDRIPMYYDINLNKVDDYSVYIEGSGGFADEVAVFKMKDEKDDTYIKDVISKRIEQRKKDFTGYNSWELDKIEKNQVSEEGKYVCFIISDNVDKANNIFEGYFKK